MDGGHWVAADGKHRTPGGGIAGANGLVSPAGRLHAVDPVTEEVLCGQPIGRLVPFPEMQWTGIRSGIRCSDCVRALAG